jgi:AHBA synthesis associated protein
MSGAHGAGGGQAAAVFDLDGVLADTFAVMREAFAIAYAEVVGPGEPPFAEYRTHMGRYFPDIMRLMGLPLALERPFVRASTELSGKVTVYPGVPELLQTLRDRQVRLAVATGKSGRRARALLDQLGLLDLFDLVTGGDEVTNPKPAPDIILQSLRRLEVPPDRAMMIGDAPADLASAHAAEVHAVAASWGTENRAALLSAAPDYVAEHPAAVLLVADRLGLTRRATAISP